MNFNPAAYVGAIVREVTRRDHRAKPAWVVIATRDYDTDIDDLWDALTSAERIPRWFRSPVSSSQVAVINSRAMLVARSGVANHHACYR